MVAVRRRIYGRDTSDDGARTTNGGTLSACLSVRSRSLRQYIRKRNAGLPPVDTGVFMRECAACLLSGSQTTRLRHA